MLKSLPFANLHSLYPSSHMVARQLDGSPIYWKQLLERIDDWDNRLKGISADAVAVFHENSLEFVSILFSLWKSGKTPIIPGNTLEVTVNEVKKLTSIFIGTFENTEDPIEPPTFSPETDDTALILFTSGSTGKPTPISKTFQQINNELSILEKHFGSQLEDSLIVGSVSHHHMYGLPFRLLWPLTTGRPFVDKEIIYLEQIQTLQSDNSISLITSPAHLNHLPETMDWEKISLNAIFSAGAPLSETAAKNAALKFQQDVTEIYGSTETGAIATRQQLKEIYWSPLDSINIQSQEGQLAAKRTIDKSWFVSKDLCELNSEQKFLLKGRADRIIKIGGKRISATAIEHLLETHSWIQSARVLVLDNKKSRVGAIVVLNDEGKAKLVDLGKLTLCKKLSTVFEHNIERVAWPRYWRFVTEFPSNAQGKSTLHDLEQLFENDKKETFPHIINQQNNAEADESTITLKIPNNLVYLEGHFPGRPILPGVVQIKWALHYGKELTGQNMVFKGLEALKFQHVIQPDQQINLKLNWDHLKNKLSFSYTSKNTIHSSGRIIYSKETQAF